MKTNKLIAAAVAASFAVAAPTSAFAVAVAAPAKGPVFHGTAVVPWTIIGCAGGVVLAALAANYRDNRQLTAQEAWTCGFLFLFSQPKKK